MFFFVLQETLHNHKIDGDVSHDESFDALKDFSESHKVTERNEKGSLLKNWPLRLLHLFTSWYGLHRGVCYSSSIVIFGYLTHNNIIFSFSFSHRSFHCGLTVQENMEVWATQPMMSVQFLQSQVCLSSASIWISPELRKHELVELLLIRLWDCVINFTHQRFCFRSRPILLSGFCLSFGREISGTYASHPFCWSQLIFSLNWFVPMCSLQVLHLNATR